MNAPLFQQLNPKARLWFGLGAGVTAIIAIVLVSQFTTWLDPLWRIFGSKAAGSELLIIDTEAEFRGVGENDDQLSFRQSDNTIVSSAERSYIQPESPAPEWDGYVTVDAALFGNFANPSADGGSEPNPAGDKFEIQPGNLPEVDNSGNTLDMEQLDEMVKAPAADPSQEVTSTPDAAVQGDVIGAQAPEMTYSTPAYKLAGKTNLVHKFSVADFQPADGSFSIRYQYRIADSLTDLLGKDFVQAVVTDDGISDGNIAYRDLLPESGNDTGAFVQYRIVFSKSGTAMPSFAPAVYSMTATYEVVEADIVVVEEEGNDFGRLLVVNYGAAPASANVKLYGADPNGAPLISREDESLVARNSLTLPNVLLEDGKQYMISLHSEGFQEKLVQFTVIPETDLYQFNVGDFKPLTANDEMGELQKERVVDVNGDGKINLADLSLFLEFYGKQASEGLPLQQ